MIDKRDMGIGIGMTEGNCVREELEGPVTMSGRLALGARTGAAMIGRNGTIRKWPACQVLKRDAEIPGMIGVIEVCEEISLVPSSMKYAPRMTRKVILKDMEAQRSQKRTLYWVL